MISWGWMPRLAVRDMKKYWRGYGGIMQAESPRFLEKKNRNAPSMRTVFSPVLIEGAFYFALPSLHFSTLPIIAGKFPLVVPTFCHGDLRKKGPTQPFLQIRERDFAEKVSTFGLDKPFTASDVCGQAKAVFSAAHDGSANMAELCSTTSNASFGHRILSLTLLNDHGA